MRLKRGVERASCDFCHGRKIKCDRAACLQGGDTQCSPCSLRRIACRLRVKDDPRSLRRESNLIPSSSVPIPRERPTQVSADDESAGSMEARPLSHSPATGTSKGPPSDSHLDHMWSDAPFDLSADNILFLDQVFMESHDDSLALRPWDEHFAIPETVPPHARPQTNTETEGSGSPGLQDGGDVESWLQCDVDTPTLMAAIRAYFGLATLPLPIIFEDAFWADFNAKRCSRALVYAIACRGAPFVDIAQKWETQQRIAQLFRDAFMAEQASRGEIGLDVLEAHALMLHFEYDESNPSQKIQSRFGSLFLSHESLVISTLQWRASQAEEQSLPPLSQEQVPLSRYDERRVLLFWHVYGLDAFHCLDKQCMSRIQVDHLATPPGLSGPLQDGDGYLDAVLALATMARRIHTLLCSPASKRQGVKAADVHDLYDQMERWGEKECPSWLQRHKDNLVVDAKGSSVEHSRLNARLKCTMVSFLEVNCRMQIERCVSQFGLRDAPSIEADIAASRVRYHFLRAMRDAWDVSGWVKTASEEEDDGAQPSLVDLAPSILRDIYIGVCFRACTHARSVEQDDEGLPSSQNYVALAQSLRDAAATATSHSDTAKTLKPVDDLLASLGNSKGSPL